ncbi:FtsX-like permease family protein [Siminovitchia sp. FSL H7-0308]|uniref:ABC transporter permease n=1 Tax=Siminovitchia sp. FSL H7-0308 TaxID=2921432 RepID=UPI0030EB7C6E
MSLKDQFRFVKQNMKKNKRQMFMTIVATAIGCAFLIVLASVGFGLHKAIIKEMLEGRLVTEIDVNGKENEAGSIDQLTDRHIEYFEALENVKVVTRRQNLQQTPSFTIGEFTASAEAFVPHFPSELKAGFKLSEGRLPAKDNEIVVSHTFSKDLSHKAPDGVAPYHKDGTLKNELAFKDGVVGKTVDMEVLKINDGKETKASFPLTIVGVAEKPAKDWLSISNVYISETILQEVEKFTGTPRGNPEKNSAKEKTYDSVKIYAQNAQAVSDIIEKLDADNYITYSIHDEMKQVNKLFMIIKTGLLFIGTIAIIIASIGIYNTMTMAVTERAPDIGIMKAIGAKPKTIKSIFLLESSYIGFLGAVIGSVVAYGISSLVNFSFPLVFEHVFDETFPEGLLFSYIPWTLTISSMAICFIVTIFSGWRPAQRATKIDVLRAIRREV